MDSWHIICVRAQTNKQTFTTWSHTCCHSDNGKMKMEIQDGAPKRDVREIMERSSNKKKIHIKIWFSACLFFEMGFLLCCPGCCQTPRTNGFSHPNLPRSCDYRHLPPHRVLLIEFWSRLNILKTFVRWRHGHGGLFRLGR